MSEFMGRCGHQVQGGNVAINDFSASPPQMFIMDRTLNRCVAVIPITYGAGSQQHPPQPGSTPNMNETPAGFHITKVHNGGLFQEHNSIGLSGTGSENNTTLSRGVLIHPNPPGSATQGCIGVPPEQFALVKSSLAYGTVVYNHFANQPAGSSKNNCTAPGTSGAGAGNRGNSRSGRD